jgi:hypothetical protein
MLCDLSLRLKGSCCLPNFAGWNGYSSIAAFLIDPRADAMGQEETLWRILPSAEISSAPKTQSDYLDTIFL